MCPICAWKSPREKETPVTVDSLSDQHCLCCVVLSTCDSGSQTLTNMLRYMLGSACILLACISVCVDDKSSNQCDVKDDAPRIQSPNKVSGTEILYVQYYAQHKTILKICSKLFNTSNFLFLFSNLKRFPNPCHNRNHRTTLLYLCILLVSRSSDIESNPGPDFSECTQNGPNTKYPCGYCHLEVTWSNIMSIMCDNCDRWFHADCQGIGHTTFDILSQSKASWCCNQCNFPNYSQGLFESLDTLTDTSSSHFSYTNNSVEDCADPSLASSSIGSPQAFSSPKSTNPVPDNVPKHKPKYSPKRLTVLNMNCRSVVDKKLELKYLTDQTKPDIIAGTESWLNPTHFNNEIFDTETYSIFRKDRTNKKGGGVFLAIKHCLNPIIQPDLDSDSEIIWAKIDVPGLKSVLVGSFYKPKENDLESLRGLRDSLSKIPRSSLIWLLGDFNLPQIDWDTEQIKQNCSYTSVYDSFLKIIHDFGLEQIVKIPTRNNNTLDLFLLNQPSLVHSTKTLPPLGQGDHDIVHHELKINPGRRKQKQRHIKFYKKDQLGWIP